MALGGGYVAADAGYINLPFALPFHVMPQKAKAPVTNTMPVTSVTTKTTPTTPKTTTTTLKDVAPVLSATFSGPTASYTNKDLGVSFNYPKIWGDIKLATEQSELKKGSRYVLTFSNLKLISAGLLTRDYEEPARDGHCPTTLGIYPAATLESYRNGYKEGDSETNTSTAKSSTRILLSNSQEFVYENFFAGENDGYPVCNSVTLGGLRGFATKSPTTGIEFFWSTMDTAKEIPVSEFATYKNDPTKYMANADRQDLLAVVKSVKEL